MDERNESEEFELEMHIEDDLESVTIVGNEMALKHLEECCHILINQIPGSHFHFTKAVLGTEGNITDLVIIKK